MEKKWTPAGGTVALIYFPYGCFIRQSLTASDGFKQFIFAEPVFLEQESLMILFSSRSHVSEAYIRFRVVSAKGIVSCFSLVTLFHINYGLEIW